MQKFKEWRSSTCQIKHWLRKGLTQEEAILKVAECQSKISLKGNNEATRLKRSRKSTGENNPMSLESIAKRNGVRLEQASSLTPCFGRVGEKHPMFGKKHTDEAIRKIGRHLNTTQMSKVEHELTSILVNKYGGGKNQSAGGWSCDYVHSDKRIIVEFFGDFWHHNPALYSDDWINPFTRRDTRDVHERDARKVQELTALGFIVIVVWERDWRRRREDQLKRVEDAFNQL